jgi:hypothetical protein
MNASKTLSLALVIGAAVLMVSAAYAASITLSSANVMQIGGTGQVTVNCPVGNTCTVSGVTWSVTQSGAAPVVNSATVTWQTASTSSTNKYTLYVTVFSSASTVVATGSVSNIAGSASPTSTTVTLTAVTPPLNPSQVNLVEIDIVQTA